MFVINPFVISSVFQLIVRYQMQISFVDDFAAINYVVQDRFVVAHNNVIVYVVKNPVTIVVIAVKNVTIKVKYPNNIALSLLGFIKIN